MVEDVYVANTATEGLCIFARVGEEVKIYRPDDYFEKYLSIGLEEWRRLAASYSRPNDLDLYDEVVNAGSAVELEIR
jgi:hypothetical protein